MLGLLLRLRRSERSVHCLPAELRLRPVEQLLQPGVCVQSDQDVHHPDDSVLSHMRSRMRNMQMGLVLPENVVPELLQQPVLLPEPDEGSLSASPVGSALLYKWQILRHHAEDVPDLSRGMLNLPEQWR